MQDSPVLTIASAEFSCTNGFSIDAEDQHTTFVGARPCTNFGADVLPAMTVSMQGDCTDFWDLVQLVRLQGSPIFGADVFACGDFVNAGRLH